MNSGIHLFDGVPFLPVEGTGKLQLVLQGDKAQILGFDLQCGVMYVTPSPSFALALH